jgi:hypothetical protein
MPPTQLTHECHQNEIIEAIRGRLGTGDVTLATINQTLVQVLEQVKKTNGRVTRLERFSAAVRWCTIGALGFLVADSAGVTEALVRMFLK